MGMKFPEKNFSMNSQNKEVKRKKTLGIVILEGLTPLNFYALFWCSMVMLIGITCVSVIQPIFLKEVIKVPQQHFGKINANLLLLKEIAVILFLGISGALSDKYGRKILMTLGLLISGLLFIVFGYADHIGRATDTNSLIWVFIMRFFYAVTLTFAWPQVFTILGDYTEHESRGKGNAIIGVLSGIGAMLTFILISKIPEKFGILAGFYICGGLLIFTALISHFGIVDRLPKDISKRKKTIENLKEAMSALKASPGLKLSYAASFISRATVAILGTFMMAWAVKIATTSTIEGHKATATAGMIIGISALAGLITAPLWGILIDKWGRMPALTLSLFLTGLGFVLMGFITNPFIGLTKVCVIFCGIGQIGLMIASTTLAIDLSPQKVLGSVLGGFNTFGAIGISIIGTIGGFLFDEVSYTSPFVLTGIVNFLVLLWAIIVYKKVPKITGKSSGAPAH